jgi:ethanolamine utilization protein EutJ
MNPDLSTLLAHTDRVMAGANGWHPEREFFSQSGTYGGKLHVGVDLGTAYSVLVVLDENYRPIAGEYQQTEIVRDGLVVDFVGAVDVLRDLKARVEKKLSVPLTAAATAYPPGVPEAEVRATANVLYGADLECSGLIDEPSAANNVLQIRDGAIVDVGGGTTGIAVIKNGKVIHTADEATGGTHFSLVIAGATGLDYDQAETIKKDPNEQNRLFPLVRPVMEKVGSIVCKNVRGHDLERIYLVGGTCLFPGMDKVIEEMTGVETVLPGNPLFVTPLGIAMFN